MAKKMNALYMECSSKEMSGVDEIFEHAINIVVANDPSNLQQTVSRQSGQAVQYGGMRKKKRNCRFL